MLNIRFQGRSVWNFISEDMKSSSFKKKVKRHFIKDFSYLYITLDINTVLECKIFSLLVILHVSLLIAFFISISWCYLFLLFGVCFLLCVLDLNSHVKYLFF